MPSGRMRHLVSGRQGSKVPSMYHVAVRCQSVKNLQFLEDAPIAAGRANPGADGGAAAHRRTPFMRAGRWSARERPGVRLSVTPARRRARHWSRRPRYSRRFSGDCRMAFRSAWSVASASRLARSAASRNWWLCFTRLRAASRAAWAMRRIAIGSIAQP